MKIAAFNATCPFEIGDRVNYNGSIQTITDIACTHYLKEGKIEFFYELDNGSFYPDITISKSENGGAANG